VERHVHDFSNGVAERLATALARVDGRARSTRRRPAGSSAISQRGCAQGTTKGQAGSGLMTPRVCRRAERPDEPVGFTHVIVRLGVLAVLGSSLRSPTLHLCAAPGAALCPPTLRVRAVLGSVLRTRTLLGWAHLDSHILRPAD
jgi:hypothetical protein